jgi:hypothetical protein
MGVPAGSGQIWLDTVNNGSVMFVRDHGFGRAGQRQYARDDGLLGRRVMFVPGTSLSAAPACR